MSFTLHGISVSKGIAIGRAYLMEAARLNVERYLIEAEQIDTEISRFFSAHRAVQQELDMLRNELPADMPSEMEAFLNVHALILHDSTLTDATAELIRTRRYNAEWALTEQLKQLLSHFDEMEDEYFRERKADVANVVERILKVLAGSPSAVAELAHVAHKKPQQELIIVAHDIAPADMLQFKTKTFSGFVTEFGGRTSHTAIAARSLGIPAAVGVHQAGTLIRHNDLIIIDGDQGVVIVDPAPKILEEYLIQQKEKATELRRLRQLKSSPSQTLDGTPIHLYANIELPEDATSALKAGASGIGLFRTEFFFMNRRSALPTEEEQFEAYRHVVKAMKGRPVTIRTFDIGADKLLDPRDADNAEGFGAAANPALGLRAIRWSLSEPQMFLTHLRAILRASAFGPVKILFPMLSCEQEIVQALHFVAQAKQQCDEAGILYGPQIQLGAMIEIPAAVLALPLFLKKFDFLSIGTNDLIQYALAIDRTDSAVAHLYEPLHPAVLRLIYCTLRQAKRAGVPVSVCGEMAGDPMLTRLLLAMGLTEFSMQPSQLMLVKQEILQVPLATLKKAARTILTAYGSEEIQAALRHLASL